MNSLFNVWYFTFTPVLDMRTFFFCTCDTVGIKLLEKGDKYVRINKKQLWMGECVYMVWSEWNVCGKMSM